jgi:hypothetical protein
VIETTGVEWDQPRLGYMSAPGGMEAAGKVEISYIQHDDGVEISRLVPDQVPSQLFKKVWTKTPLVDNTVTMRWRLPSVLNLDVEVKEPGGERDGAYLLPSLHLLTPESESSTHYHWAVARNFETDNQEITGLISQFIKRAFEEEDVPILDAAQGNFDLVGEDAEFANFTIGDRASMKTRQMIDQAMQDESLS